MKKLRFFAFALVASALAFKTSCNGDDNGPSEILEDAFYLQGPATEFSSPTAHAMFFGGVNEYGQVPDGRIHEMYAFLNPGTFYIAVVEGGRVARTIGGTATGYEYPGQDRTSGGGDQAWGARFYTPVEGGTFTITEAGLHHIVYFQGDQAANFAPLVMVARADMGLRGDINGWGFTSLGTPERVANGLDWSFEMPITSFGQFKLAYNGGWKLPMLFDDGNPVWDVIMINTNLGAQGGNDGDVSPPITAMLQGGPNWAISGNPGLWRFTLSWRSNVMGHGFTSLTATFLEAIIIDPAGWYVGFSGGIFPNHCGWCAPNDPDGVLATLSTEQTNVTNAENNAGTYVWTIENLQIDAGDGAEGRGFQLRVDGAWVGGANFTITGDTGNFSGSGDVAVAVARTYNVTITIEFSGTAVTSRTVNFEPVQ